MENESNKQFQRNDVFSKRIRAGKRRTYFFDVRTTKGNDYYLTITESKKRFHDDGYERHKIFVYKEDFNKFIHTLEEVVSHIKDNLMPEYDFDMYTREPEDVTLNGEDDHENGYYDHDSKGSGYERSNGLDADSDDEDRNGVAADVQSSGDDHDDEVIRWD